MSDVHEVTDEIATGETDVIKTPSADESSIVPFDPAYDSRRQRIFDHRVEAQADPNTMIACMAGVGSDLLDLELIVAERLRQGLAAAGGSLEAIERHSALFDLVLRLSKQITQVGQMEQRSRKQNGEGVASKPR